MTKERTLNNTSYSFTSKYDNEKTVTTTEGIPLVSKSGLSELILLLQQMRSPTFQIGILNRCSNDFSTDHCTSHPDELPLVFDVFQDTSPKN